MTYDESTLNKYTLWQQVVYVTAGKVAAHSGFTS